MSTPILATKFYIPPPRPHLIQRLRLIKRLTAGLHGKLTLIAAPAGFGKTTLISDWIQQKAEAAESLQPLPVAWLSLDEADSEPQRFLTYLVAALQTVWPTLGEGVLQGLQAPQPPPTETLLTILVNELIDQATPLLLVLDDYHLCATPALDQALTFLLDHLPPQVHLVITTREDPNLPLARYRVRNQLTEVRADDLRFTPDEAAAFLNGVMGLTLSAAEVAALEARTEGWIAGLQLAALSMRGRTDVASFITAFAGNNRYIVDYLIEEVLQRQPAAIRTFLLQTSILDRLCAPLCDAVTEQTNGRDLLAALERGNLFVIPLDDKRQWYRYHHLFAEMLRVHLRDAQPEQAPILHRRASGWYEAHDLRADAIRHALAATDFARAADLIELAWPAMRKNRQEAAVLRWLTALPDTVVRRRPVLSVAYALALLDEGALAAAEQRLLDAEQWLDKATTSRVVVDESQLRSLPAAIANARAYRAQALGAITNTITYARRALDLLPADDYYERGTAAALLGLAYWASGLLAAAHTSFADGLANLQRAGGSQIAIGGATILAEICSAQGHLYAAYHTYEQALQLAVSPAHPMPLATADLHRGISEIYLDWGDQAAAAQHLLRSKELGRQSGLQGDAWRWCIAQARLMAAQGQVDQALSLLTEAEGLYYRTPIPDVRPIAAIKARLWVTQGRLTEALAWARTGGFSAADELSYLREYEQITFARLLLAQGQSEPTMSNQTASPLHNALTLLTRLLQAAETGARMGSQIEILLLQALALAAQGDYVAAHISLARALALAEPEGYVQIFVEQGAALLALLTELKAESGQQSAYLDKVLAAFGPPPAPPLPLAPPSSPPAPQPSALSLPPLAEPLSERELALLRLFKTELTGPAIARELVIALSTVRTHTKNIYSKLNVNSRQAAVKRATELGLL